MAYQQQDDNKPEADSPLLKEGTLINILFCPLAVVQLNVVPEHVVCLPTLDVFKDADDRLQQSRP